MTLLLLRLRNRHLLVHDVVYAAITPLLAFVLRFEGVAFSPDLWKMLALYTTLALGIKIVLFQALGLYGSLWRYASIAEVERIFVAGSIAGIVCVLLGAFVLPASGLTAGRVPLSVLALDAIATVAIVAFPRLAIRFAATRTKKGGLTRKRAIVAGAGVSGQAVLRDSENAANADYKVVAFLDDDPSKRGLLLGGVHVAGGLTDLKRVVREMRASEVIIAIPRARGAVIRQIVDDAKDAGATTRIVPSLRDILTGRVAISKLRKVEIHDLLRRDPIKTDLAQVRKLAEGRSVLVTGGGGSIGSELCRQIAELNPARLVVLDHAENPVFAILSELRLHFPNVDIVPVIADIRNPIRIRKTLKRYAPAAVFHAAAHKHVPLMEENVFEAVTNNLIGTRNVVDAALDTDVEHFVLISTDKAVRPTSVMGATKRLAEHIVHHAAITEHRNFVSVRFGNVLGSSGSVVPTFLDQIQRGGPVTVTHPDMRRYFMTIPEAVQLVLQAAALGTGGELFVLDMGEPVRVVDLARDLIRLSGLDEDEIEIVFTGVRPGEKLFEELFLGGESVTGTRHPKVLRARNDDLDAEMTLRIDTLVQRVLANADDSIIREMLHLIVPDFALMDARAKLVRPRPTPPEPELAQAQGAR